MSPDRLGGRVCFIRKHFSFVCVCWGVYCSLFHGQYVRFYNRDNPISCNLQEFFSSGGFVIYIIHSFLGIIALILTAVLWECFILVSLNPYFYIHSFISCRNKNRLQAIVQIKLLVLTSLLFTSSEFLAKPFPSWGISATPRMVNSCFFHWGIGTSGQNTEVIG